ncbi:o-succinylbenzoate synthase [Halorubellus sp. JP-L1]|uniref:mandelate racemase/muconate lactonizing enzyme family protein n=1 Tax=Halorubellus sp. JP-L1 TaxID=2715753 RepID=UPI001407E409|nr:o-succinylbenzoate synthase [Halorubellus sp. JP-L1]NHN40456.1 o-succinylbenzoate synthase [Halorubellus sp. JP-L1]
MDAEFREFAVSLSRPLATANGEITDREGFLVRVSDGEHEGFGEATPLAQWTESHAECRGALSDAVSRLQDDEAALRADLDRNPAARHGVALALADLRAKQHDRPLYRLLGRRSEREWVPVNATVGDAAPDDTAAAAERAVAEGYETVKVKVGTRGVERDVERLRAVRDAVGDDVSLRADANGAWDREEAERALSGFADAGVRYVEQPLPADDLAGMAALRGGPVGVAVDETLAAHSVQQVLDAGAADVLVLKPMALGGVERARRAAVEAREENVASVVTTTIDAVVARAGAVHVAASLAGVLSCGLATGDWLSTDLGPDPCFVDDGSVRVPQEAGLGVHAVWEDDDA